MAVVSSRRSPVSSHQNGRVAGIDSGSRPNAAGTRGNGRFAPSPTGALHLGNLRTALVSWLFARAAGAGWLVRMEDLDPLTSSRRVAAAQLDELAALGLRADGEVVFQSDRFALHHAAIGELREADLVYECFCSRREIRDAARAPHSEPSDHPDGAYPGTCRDLDDAARRRFVAAGRQPALRLRTDGGSIGFDDLVLGAVEGRVDDVVLQRNDGVPAYNLAVVVDDAEQGVTQVVRGDDLASSTPRQILLQRLLRLPTPTYAHVPLVVGADGARLAKRHGAVTIGELTATGIAPAAVLARLGASLGLCDADATVTPDDLLAAFSPERIPRRPTRVAELVGDAPAAGFV
ncbi:MAG: gluQ [Ilumatobacteraceae bacterium]|nr:gluQ [Ilumatobacteraceae bacterium]